MIKVKKSVPRLRGPQRKYQRGVNRGRPWILVATGHGWPLREQLPWNGGHRKIQRIKERVNGKKIEAGHIFQKLSRKDEKDGVLARMWKQQEGSFSFSFFSFLAQERTMHFMEWRKKKEVGRIIGQSKHTGHAPSLGFCLALSSAWNVFPQISTQPTPLPTSRLAPMPSIRKAYTRHPIQHPSLLHTNPPYPGRFF